MGFWGAYVVARCDAPLEDVLGYGRQMHRWRGADGWQVIQTPDGPDAFDESGLAAFRDRLIASVTTATGSPVLTAVFMDSDGAYVSAFAPGGDGWNVWLMLDRIIVHIDDDAWPDFVEDGEGGYLPIEDETYHARYAAITHRLHTALAVSPSQEATAQAIRWAADISLVADRTAVRSALSGREAFAEDLFFDLLTALGLPDFQHLRPT